jgi:hypothetical protein
MSEQAAEGITISQSVEAHLSNILGAQGQMITGYLGIVTYLDDDGNNCWSFLRSEHATATGDLGMARVITKHVENDVDHLMFCNHDDES